MRSPGSVVVSAEAMEILWGEEKHLFWLYAWLAKVMDDATCVAGLRRRINDQAVKEQLEVHSRVGHKGSEPSRQFCRSALERLENLGLIEARGQHVFFLPYESERFSGQNIYNQATTNSQPSYNQEKSSYNKELRNDATSFESGDTAIYNPHLINQSINQSGVDLFPMRTDWVPSEYFPAKAALMMLDVKERDRGLMLGALADLRIYWTDDVRKHIRRDQGHWERTLLHTMQSHARRVKSGAAYSKPTASERRERDMLAFPALPARDDDLEAWAAKLGGPSPGYGHTFKQYREVLMDWRSSKLAEIRGKQA